MDSVVDFYRGLNAREAVMFYVFCFSVVSTLLSCIAGQRYVRLLSGIFFLFPRERAQALAAEVSRKSFHMLGSICGILLHKVSVQATKKAGIVLCLAACHILVFEALRINVQPVNRVYQRLFGSLMRAEEKNKITGMTSFFFGLGLSLCLFSKQAAEFALYSLFLGDTAAAFFGIAFGRHRLTRTGRKSVEGFLGCALVCAGLVYVCGSAKYWVALVPALAELLCGDVVQVNDNVLIPLASGLAFGGWQGIAREVDLTIKCANRMIGK